MDGFRCTGAAHHRRHRRGAQGAAHRRGDPGAHARAVRAAALAALQPHAHRGARRRVPTTARTRARRTREAVLQVAVMHPQKEALELFAREIAPAGTSWSPGTTGAGWPAEPVAGDPPVRLPGRQGGAWRRRSHWWAMCARGGAQGPGPGAAANMPAAPAGRSPRKTRTGRSAAGAPGLGAQRRQGQPSNIGVIARRPEWLPWLREQLTEERVKDWLGAPGAGEVTRFDVPGIHA
jgi:hypothetical protein